MTPGCYADGAFGHHHVRLALAQAVADLGITQQRAVLIESLRGPMPDGAWDEQDALALLNEHTGLVWGLFNDDLFALTPKQWRDMELEDLAESDPGPEPEDLWPL